MELPKLKLNAPTKESRNGYESMQKKAWSFGKAANHSVKSSVMISVSSGR